MSEQITHPPYNQAEPPAILLEDIGVSYRTPNERVRSFKEYVILWLQRRVRYQDVWALRNINL